MIMIMIMITHFLRPARRLWLLGRRGKKTKFTRRAGYFLTFRRLKGSKHVKVAPATCGQIVANCTSVFPADFDKSSKYGAARVAAYLSMAFYTKPLHIP